MPPRVPVVFLFVAAYFAVVWGGGVAAPGREAVSLSFVEAPDWLARWFGLPVLRLTFADILALLAAVFALPDSALRPARSASDRVISVACAGVAVGALAFEPLLTSPAYAILLALSLGDALGCLGAALVRDRRPRPF